MTITRIIHLKDMNKIVITMAIAIIFIISLCSQSLAITVEESWTARYNSGRDDLAYGIATDSFDNVIVTGSSSDNYYTIKYNPYGTFIWGATYNGGNVDCAYGVTVDSQNNIIVTGVSYIDNLYYFDNDYYTIKYDSNGNELWHVYYDSGGDDCAYGVTVDSQDNVIVTGCSEDDYYTIKYDSDGNEIWNASYDGGNIDCAYGVTVDSQDNIIVTGFSYLTDYDYYTIKYNPNGGIIWDVNWDNDYADTANAVAVDSLNNVIVTGTSDYDYYTVKYDSNGNELWNVSYDKWVSSDCAYGVATDYEDNIIVTGSADQEYYTIKYDANGNIIWIIDYAGPLRDRANAVTIDSLGKVTIAGSSKNGVYYDYYTIRYNQLPLANFTYTPSSPTDIETIYFTDVSIDIDGVITAWLWDFDDGNTSSVQNPTHQYADDGSYTVSLTVWDDDGAYNSTSQVISVSNVDPVADFVYNPLEPSTSNVIQFTDSSSDIDGNVVAWSWDFDDGNSSAVQNPTHQYADDGSYTVSLTIWDDDGATDIASHVISVANVDPVADFDYSPLFPSDLDTIYFSDTSSDSDGYVVSWLWDFDDGNTSSVQNPVHQYADDGSYTVSLTVWDDDGATDIASQVISVLNIDPVADFDYSPLFPSDLDTIYFSDTSSDSDGYVVSWLWDFDDGNTSSVQNPAHQYADDGSYTVSLTVWDDDGATDIASQVISISNVDPVADFVYNPLEPSTSNVIQFTDNSSDIDGDVVSWLWDFDDGNTSSAQNPTHQYADDGSYTVTLTVWDDDGATDSVEYDITVSNQPPIAGFNYEFIPPTSSGIVYFNSTSYDLDGKIFNFTWNFGDGGFAYTEEATYQYVSDGAYTVNLTVRDDDGASDSIEQEIIIDTTPPEITDNTPSTGTTGDSFIFSAEVTDNYEVSAVYVEYWYGVDTHINISMDYYGSYEKTVTIEDTLETLHCIISAVDNSNNWNNTNINDVTIFDNDRPNIINIQDYPDPQESSGYVNITCNVNDNIDVDTVKVDITGPTGFTHVNTTMIGGTYYYNATYEILGIYTYFIWANDTSGNINISTTGTFLIRDTIAPEIIDNSPTYCTTGDSYTFNATVTDNIMVNFVQVTYWYEGDIPTTECMVNTNGDDYEYTIIIENTLNTLYYNISAEDTSGNNNDTGIKNVNVNDNDPPILSDDQTDSNCTTSETVTFKVNATDNIEIEHVYVYWRKIGESYTQQEMSGGGITYNWTYTIDPNDKTNIEYYFEAVDAVPLTDTMYSPDSPATITIVDNDPPLISNVEANPNPQECGEDVNITCVVVDNIGVDIVKVDIVGPEGFTHVNISMDKTAGSYYYNAVYSILGTYTYFIWANDSSGNANVSESHTFLIEDTTPPEIIDNSPTYGTTGDSYTFNATVTDNNEVATVYIEYWYGNNGSTIKQMINIADDYYICNIIIEDTSDILHYEIFVKDVSNNWNNTVVKDVIIVDNDVPEITDNTGNIAYTGNQFTFNTTATDNIQVSDVYVEYWYNSGDHTNVSMVYIGSNWFEKIITVDDVIGELYYNLSVRDTSDNWNGIGIKDVMVIDDDPPLISNIGTSPNSQETGGYVNITCNVNDNIDVDTVKVDITGPTGLHVNTTMIGGPYYYNATYEILGAYTYYIWAKDTSDNTNISTSATFYIGDTTPPQITDHSPNSCTTGDSYTFNATVTDNVEVQWVQVTYWYGNNEYTIKDMVNVADHYYEYTIIVENTLETLHYQISTKDPSDNWNNTCIKDVGIIDNDVPEIVDNTNNLATTGDLFTFMGVITDNIEVTNVYVEYWYNTAPHTNVSMINTQADTYETTITVDNILGEIHYIIAAEDTSNNWNDGGVQDVTIMDDDLPQITNIDATPNPQEYGGYVNITCDATDNIAVDTVKVDIVGPEGFTPINTTMSVGCYHYNVTYDILGTYTYYIWAIDTSSNVCISEERTFLIQDTTSPQITDHSPNSCTTGDSYTFNATVTDNCDVDWVQVTYWYGSSSPTVVYMTNTADNYYELTITVEDTLEVLFYHIFAKDTSNNGYQTITKDVPVLDNDLPEITDVAADPPLQREGRYVNIICNVTDNIGLSEVMVNITGPDDFATINTPMNGLDNTYSYNNSYTIIGEYSFFIWAKDQGNNENQSQHHIFKIYNNTAPNEPDEPSPEHGEENVSIDADLSWSSSDPDGDPLVYDVYFGTNNPPSLVSTNHDSNSYNPGKMTPETTYYWQIISDDGINKTNGSIWCFTTLSAGQNNAPNTPEIPSGPCSGYTNQSYHYATITDDADNNTIKYEFDWGDETTTQTSWYNSGESITCPHIWLEQGTYTIQVRAFDGIEWSGWSPGLNVSISIYVPPPPPSKNKKPIADAGGPYTGVVGVPVIFDGSGSTDDDGTIELYEWDFGDVTTGTGMSPNHTYIEVGDYTITLTVTDNGSKTDTDTTNIIVTENSNLPEKPDLPPSEPEIDGTTRGNTNADYIYIVNATDPDDDMIRYVFNWDDGTNTTTDYVQNGTGYIGMHNWENPGVYIIRVFAEDEHNKRSGITELMVLIDVDVKFIDKTIDGHVIKGYLIDYDMDGIYDVFYNNETGEEMDVERQGDGTYMIDIDHGDKWYYIYNPHSDSITKYEQREEGDETKASLFTFTYLMIIVILFIVGNVIYFIYYRPKKVNNKKNRMVNKTNKIGNKIITKIAFCPKCNSRVSVNGTRGQKFAVTCPHCSTSGVVKI